MGHKQDFLEWFRSTVYPLLHWGLDLLGIGALGTLPEAEYVGTIPAGVEEFEQSMHYMGIKRNALAKYKSTEDGRKSIGSWRITHHDMPEFAKPGMQLHITLFPPRDSPQEEAVDVYAHYERDYGHDASGHLAGKDYSSEEGVRRAEELIYSRSSWELEDRRD